MGATTGLGAAAIVNPVMLLATALTAGQQIYQGISANQQAQHAKGAAEAQQKTMQDQIDKANAQTATDKASRAMAGSATQAAALAALRASMNASSGFGGSILTSPTGAIPTPTSGKSLLGA